MNPLLWLTKKTLGRYGFGVHQTRFDVKKYGYTRCMPYTYHTYSPWFSPWFQPFYDLVKDVTVLTADRCYMLYRFSQHCQHIPGDFAECGVYKGGSAMLLTLTVNPHRELHLFDTFRGMPKTGVPDPSEHREGDMGDVSLANVKEYLQCPQAVYHPGVIPETFRGLEDEWFAFVHIDVDLYQSTRDCLEYFYPRMSVGAVMVFDDYGFPRYEYAEKKAVDDYFSDKVECPISLRTGQCIIIKV